MDGFMHKKGVYLVLGDSLLFLGHIDDCVEAEEVHGSVGVGGLQEVRPVPLRYL
jgi:hypothetical protein